jgi:hypothetical protein
MGRSILAAIGCTKKRSAEPRNTAAVKSQAAGARREDSKTGSIVARRLGFVRERVVFLRWRADSLWTGRAWPDLWRELAAHMQAAASRRPIKSFCKAL